MREKRKKIEESDETEMSSKELIAKWSRIGEEKMDVSFFLMIM